jgi:hypothetical protein
MGIHLRTQNQPNQGQGHSNIKPKLDKIIRFPKLESSPFSVEIRSDSPGSAKSRRIPATLHPVRATSEASL